MKKLLISALVLLMVMGFSSILKAEDMNPQIVVSLKLINDTENELEAKVEWVNHTHGCYMDPYLRIPRCNFYAGFGTVYVNKRSYESNGATWVGKPWIFNWKRDGYGEIGSIYKIRWSNGVVHEFTVTDDLAEVISRASKAEPQLKKK